MDRENLHIENVTIMEVDSEGNPIPETAQKLGDIATIELTPELDTIERYFIGDYVMQLIQNLNTTQKHYDETHSRKAKWHKRYF